MSFCRAAELEGVVIGRIAYLETSFRAGGVDADFTGVMDEAGTIGPEAATAGGGPAGQASGVRCEHLACTRRPASNFDLSIHIQFRSRCGGADADVAGVFHQRYRIRRSGSSNSQSATYDTADIVIRITKIDSRCISRRKERRSPRKDISIHL